MYGVCSVYVCTSMLSAKARFVTTLSIAITDVADVHRLVGDSSADVILSVLGTWAVISFP
jgi:hypothetical protein